MLFGVVLKYNIDMTQTSNFLKSIKNLKSSYITINVTATH